ncbi:unnamed protein product, partial [Clonostachys byssicola]
MSFLGGGLQLSGQAFYVGDDGTHQLIPQGRGPLFGGLHTLFDYTRPWCELCKVLFNVGDSMVELKPDGSVSTLCPLDNVPLKFDDFNKNRKGWVPSVQDTLPSPWAHACHPECVGERFEADVLWSALDKVAFRYAPTMAEFGRRLNWLHRELTNDLKRSNNTLSYEVWHHTAGYCLPALISAHSMSTARYNDPKETSFRVDGDIWARLVKFEGKEYIACLMNTAPPPPEDQASRVVKLRKPEGTIKALYVAFDYLGIRQLAFGVDQEPPSISPQEGLWWVTMVVDGDTFTCQSDGMKLRQMKPAACEEFPTWEQCWATPQPQDNLPCLYPIKTGDPSMLRIKFAECNLPSITGYSVRWTSNLSSFHAHVKGEEDFAFYDELKRTTQRAVWVYMPMDQGELIEQFWLRTDPGDGHRSTALIMKTDRGRVWEAGPRPKPFMDRPNTWDSMSESTERQRFFFNQSYLGISTLGFQSPSPDLSSVPAVPPPKSAPDRQLDSEQCFYSSAPLDGVTSIEVCKKKKARNEGSAPNITGLLFSYQDGRQRSVGHVRLDWLQGPTEIGASRGIAFKLSRDRREVVDLKLADHAADEGGEFIPW